MFSPKAEIKFSGLCPDDLTSKLGNTVWEVYSMDRDEILAKSREENKDWDFVEAEVLNRANSIALSVSLTICALISVLHSIFRDSVDYAVWTVQFGMMATVVLVKFSRLRRHELLLGLLYAGFSVFFFVYYLRLELGVF